MIYVIIKTSMTLVIIMVIFSGVNDDNLNHMKERQSSHPNLNVAKLLIFTVGQKRGLLFSNKMQFILNISLTSYL